MAPNAAAKKYVGTVHLKLTQFYMLIISQENWKKRSMWLDKKSIVLAKHFQQLNSDAVFEKSYHSFTLMHLLMMIDHTHTVTVHKTSDSWSSSGQKL